MDISNSTTNASLDSRAHFLIPDLPRSVSSPSKTAKKEEKTDHNQDKN